MSGSGSTEYDAQLNGRVTTTALATPSLHVRCPKFFDAKSPLNLLADLVGLPISVSGKISAFNYSFYHEQSEFFRIT